MKRKPHPCIFCGAHTKYSRRHGFCKRHVSDWKWSHHGKRHVVWLKDLLARTPDTLASRHYDYSNVVYYGATKPFANLKCEKHNHVLTAIASKHLLTGGGCPQCYFERTRKVKGREDFITKSKKLFGDSLDYTPLKQKVISTRTIVTLRCKKHNEVFTTEVKYHLKSTSGPGCKACGEAKRIKNMTRWTTEKWVAIARSIHGDKYDYSNSVLTSISHNITYACPKHGDITTRAESHIKFYKSGCRRCADDERVITQEDFIARCKEQHGEGTYDYSLTKYKGCFKKVKIVCPRHGEFKVVAASHYTGGGACPTCNPFAGGSQGEERTRSYMEEKTGWKFTRCRPKFLKGLELDGYNEKHKVAFEYNGPFHYLPIFSMKDLKGIKRRDKVKRTRCRRFGVKLIVIKHTLPMKKQVDKKLIRYHVLDS